MAITYCINCNKRISDKVLACPHCGFSHGEQDADQVEEILRRKQRQQRYRLNMYSYVALTVFIAGVIWYWVESGGFQRAVSTGPMILLTLGVLSYVVLRGMMIFQRIQARKER